MDAPKPVPDPYGSYLVDPHAQQFIATPLRPVIEHAFVQQYQTDTTVYGNIVFHTDVADHLPFSRRPQNFFSTRPVVSVCPG